MRLSLIALWGLCLWGQAWEWRRELPGEGLVGGAGSFTWGRRVLAWTGQEFREVARAEHGYHDGGCVLQGRNLVLAERPAEGELGRLVFLKAPVYRAETIDTDVELHECLPATLFGRSGFLMVHRHLQVRFYWQADGRWQMREIYSIYTPSRQGGLAMADVDGDGRTDIYCGNYWIRSPERFDLPWRIFAINLLEANFVLAPWRDGLVSLQRDIDGAPLRFFRRPADPKQLWPEVADGGFTAPRAVRAEGAGLWIGHGGGVTEWPSGRRILRGEPVVALLPGGIVVSPEAVGQPRRR